MPVQDFDFEDDRAHLNKEAQVRRKYLRWFNKRRDDFDTDGQYDEYLEMVEDVIFNMTHNINVEETKAMVDRYRRENHEQIGQNHAKRMDEDRLEKERVLNLERERIARLAELRKQDEEIEKQRQKERKQREAEELIRVAKGDDALAKIRRKKEKAERKRRRKEEAAKKAEEEKNKPDFQPTWFMPQFPSPLPVPLDKSKVSDDQRPLGDPVEFNKRSQEEKDKAAVAAGFSQRFVDERALAEFQQSLQTLRL